MTSRTPKAEKVKTPPPWALDLRTRLVGCIDGPMVGQWFFESEWRERIAAAERMLTLGQRPSPSLDYVQDGVKPHPEWPMAQGAAMYYRPKGRRS